MVISSEIAIIIANLLISISTQYCGSFRPNNVTDCTSLSTIAYQCCYLDGGLGAITACYGVRAGSLEFMPPITIYPVVQIDEINCGDTPKNMINNENLCYDQVPANETECLVRGGDNCCFMNYDNMAFCVNKKNFQLDNDPKVILQCFKTYLKLNLLFFVFLHFYTIIS